jgi:hypothetical protein
MRFLILCLIFSPFIASATTCPNVTGTYQVDKDVCFGDSYTLTYSQNGCNSLTEKGITVVTDGKPNKWCYNDGSCMIASYRFSASEFESLEIHFWPTATDFNGYDRNTISIDQNGNLLVTQNRVAKDGTQTTCANVARKIN